MKHDYLFVYGTLRKGFTNPGRVMLDRSSKYIGEATLQARMYEVRNYPGIILSDGPGDIVVGELYLLRAPEVSLKALDRYEGCGPGFSSNAEFIRRREKVKLSNSKELLAWIYLYNRPVGRLKPVSGGDYCKP